MKVMEKNRKPSALILVFAVIIAFWRFSMSEGYAAGMITIQPDPIPPTVSIPGGGARIEAFSFGLTSSAPAVVRSIVVTRSGTAPPAALADIVAMDEFGRRLGSLGFPGPSADTSISLNL